MKASQSKGAGVVTQALCFSFFIFLFVLSGTIFAENTVKLGPPPDLPNFLGYVENEFIIVLKEQAPELTFHLSPSGTVLTGIANFDVLDERFGVNRIKKQFPMLKNVAAPTLQRRKMARYYKIEFQSGTLEQAMEAYRNHPLVEHVEPIGIHTVYLEPNDPFYQDSPSPTFLFDQWHYWDTNGIRANLAWDIEVGDPNVIVAVLDTGVRYFHIDLGGDNSFWGPDNPIDNGNIWINSGEIPGNAFDDDGNGKVDDTIGWDFVSSAGGGGVTCLDQDCSGVDNDPDDGHSHGTHVSGTVAAITNNARVGAGVAGGFGNGTTSAVGNGVKIMALRIGYRARVQGQITGVVRMDWAAEAMNYVANKIDSDNINVAAVNCSWGSSNSGGLNAAVDSLLARDVMIVHAAGNSNSSSADFLGGKSGVMNVAATDNNGNGASFTNFGSWVDLAAPGVDVVSTHAEPTDPDPNNHYISVMSGTSMSAPHVCGVAALLESADPSLSGPAKFSIMVDVNNTNPYTDSRNLGSGILDAQKALQSLTPPSPPEINVKQDVNDIPSGTGSFDFGQVPVDSNQTVTFTIENLGGSDLELTGTPKVQLSGADVNSFAVTAQPTSPVSGGGSTTFDVRFAPSSGGLKNAAASISNNDPNENPYTFALAGTATVPEINVKQDVNDIPSGTGSFDFGQVLVDSNQTVTFTIENLGISNLELTGAPKVQIGGADAGSFAVTTQPTSPVSGGGSTTFDVRFAPSSGGLKNAAASIANNDPNENPYTFALVGTATVPEINVKQDVNDIPSGTGSFDFGQVLVDSNQTVTFTVENLGNLNLELTGIPKVQLSGADVNSFAVTAQPTSPVSGGGSTTFDVRFAPSSEGLKNAAVSIANNDPNENPYTFALAGTATVPEINVKQGVNDIPDAGSFDYGSVPLSQSKLVEFTVENSGTGQLHLSGSPAVQISGVDANSFLVISQPITPIEPNSSTTFEIEFSPGDFEGQHSATVTIANNDANENPYTFDVNGVGVFPIIVYVDDDAAGFMDGSEANPFDTINGGIGAAFDGTVVLVQPGIYNETIDFNDTDPNVITIRSFNPDDANIVSSTIVDGNGLGKSVFTFDSAEDANCILAGFTITEGNTTNGGGVFIDSAWPVIEKNVIVGNSATVQGSGLYAVNDSAIIRFNRFSGNDSALATVTLSDSNGAFMNNLIVNNISDFDAGLYCDDGEPLVENNTIADNETRDMVDDSSTGILLRSADANTAAIITNNIIGSNVNGTGIFDWGDGNEPPVGQAVDANVFTYNNVFGNAGGNYFGITDLTGINGNISVAPLFADANNGDYHLESEAGRWDPNSSLWVVDVNSSRCIDTGNPGCPLGDEPSDANNVRINLGAFGGTSQASKTVAGWGLLADITNDFEVDLVDYAGFALHWRGSGQCLPADFDRNNNITFADLAAIVDDWLKSIN